MDKNEPILQEIKKAVLGVEPNAEVMLFGSRARGDFHEESDWDVLVLTDEDEKDFEFKRKIRRSLLDVQLRVGEGISTIIHNKNWWNKLKATPLYSEINKDGLGL